MSETKKKKTRRRSRAKAFLEGDSRMEHELNVADAKRKEQEMFGPKSVEWFCLSGTKIIKRKKNDFGSFFNAYHCSAVKYPKELQDINEAGLMKGADFIPKEDDLKDLEAAWEKYKAAKEDK
jgi:hypothetical protein